MGIDPADYKGREQAFVKHVVLETYLKRLAFKVGQFRKDTTFNYIDGFSGPWDTRGPNDRDSSPHIALTTLEKVRSDLSSLGVPFEPRAMFVETNRAAYAKLETKCGGFPTVQTQTYNRAFEECIDEATTFAGTGKQSFGFVFIDPKGWKGYGLKKITPLLQVQPSEVLINFMTKAITRFVDHDDSSAKSTFVDLFGTDAHRAEWAGLDGIDREDRIVEVYCDRIRKAGGGSR